MPHTAFDDIAGIGERGFNDSVATGQLVRRVRKRRAVRATGDGAMIVIAATALTLAATKVASTDHTATPAADPRELFDQASGASAGANHMAAKCTPDVTPAGIPADRQLELTGTSVATLMSGATCELRSADSQPAIDARLVIAVNDTDLNASQLAMTLTIDNLLTDRALVYDMASLRVTMTAPEPAPRIDAYTQYPNADYWSQTGIDPTSVDATNWARLSVANAVPFDDAEARALMNVSDARATIDSAASRTWSLGLGAMPDPSLPDGYEHYVIAGYPELTYDWRSLVTRDANALHFTVQVDVVDPSHPEDRTTLVVRDPHVEIEN